ncbi:MAG: FecR domain-containing protein [Planctomycetaceae bacterium]|nr:FecR domain-containing protein [Planctomycetaceae bacterium]
MKNSEQLLTVYFDGALSEPERQQLMDWLRAEPGNVEQFVYASYVHRSMYDILHGQDTQKLLSGANNEEGICDQSFWEALRDFEKSAPVAKPEDLKGQAEDKVVPDRSNIQISHGKFNWFAWATALSSLAALIFLVVYVHFNPRMVSEPAAVITDAMQVGSSDASLSFRTGTRLFTRGGVLQLDQGIVKLKFDNGVDVVIEGPSRFEILTFDEISLHSGRLYAQVPHRTVGFIISTPNSKIIDLGTGFGVYADSHGNTDIHVMIGEVSVVSGTRSDVRKAQLLAQAQACRVEMNSEIIHPITFRKEAFVQDIHSKTNFVWRGQPLDLSDIAGGNGLGTGRRSVCIDLQTGKPTSDVPLGRFKAQGYVRTPAADFIDGVFIPNGAQGPIQVSSEGHLYPCPATIGETYYGIFNGSILPLRIGDVGYVDHPIQHKGQIFGTAEQPCLLLHSNMGITFDLAKVRRSLPAGAVLRSFSALCGMGEGPEGSKRTGDYSDFYVLVDGQERFAAKDMNYLSDLKAIDLKLSDADRFLTLMTTEGKDHNLHLGWSFFYKPQLTIDVADKQ